MLLYLMQMHITFTDLKRFFCIIITNIYNQNIIILKFKKLLTELIRVFVQLKIVFSF